MSNLVQLAPQYFPKSSIGTPVGAGSLYVGIPDTDPTIVSNQKTVTALQEDNTFIVMTQPITLSAGGIPLYNGSPVSLYINGKYSIKVLDINDSQIYYVPTNFISLVPGNYYYPDYIETDQGVTGNGNTIKAFVDEIGTTNKATIYLRHNSGLEFTDYLFSTTEVIPSNITLEREDGARTQDDTSNASLTINGPFVSGLTQAFDWGSGSGTISFGKGFVKELIANWWGLSTSASAANNATYFNAALKAALESGIDMYVPPGAYSCNAISYTLTDNIILPGITIRSGRSMSSETSGKTAYFNFSGLSGAAYGVEFNNTSTGQIVGMTLENISGYGPGVGETATIGLYIHGNMGIRFLTLRSTRFEEFGVGGDIAGPNGYGMVTEGASFARNVVGLKLTRIEVSTHNMLNLIQNTRSLYLNRIAAMTFNSPILQTAAAASTYGVIFDLGTGNSVGITFNSPYFESLQEYCFNVGFDSAMSSSVGSSLIGVTVNNGVYDLNGVSTKFYNGDTGVNMSSSGHSFNNINILTAAFDDPSSIVNGDPPVNSTFTLGKDQDAVEYYYDDAGNGPWKRENVYEWAVSTTDTVGTGEDDLKSTVIAANSTKAGIRVIAAGTKTGGNGDKTLKFHWGAGSYTFNVAANDTNDWRLEAIILHNGTDSQRISWVGYNGATVLQGFEAGAEDTTGAVTVKITGECAHADDTISQLLWIVEHLKDNY